MLVCYLDDSGKDPQNPIITVAGYIARDDAWQAFASEVERLCTEKHVPVIHAKELHDTDGCFKDWTRLQKQAFVAKIGQASSRHLMMGLSMSALKGSYQEHAMYRAGGSAPRRTVTSYTFCFQVIVDWILRDIRIGRAANTEGVALVLECGHENNPEAEKEFYYHDRPHSRLGWMCPAGYAAVRRSAALRSSDGSAPRTAAITAQQGITDPQTPITVG